MLIYLIRNKITGKLYIGKTSKTLEERWKAHLWNAQHLSTYLYAAMRKHGTDNFEILPLVSAGSEKELNILEREFIQQYATVAPNGYNLTLGGDGVIPSQVTRARMSVAHMGQSPANTKGLKFSQRTKSAMSAAQLKLTPEVRKERAVRAAQSRWGQFC